MKKQTHLRRPWAAVLTMAAMVVMGGASNVLALGFWGGDMGFFVYGGNTERYESFGTGSSQLVLTEGVTRDISADLPTLEVGVPAGVGLRYTVVGTSADFLTLYVSSAIPVTPTLGDESFPVNAADAFFNFSLLHAATTGGTDNFLANNPSFTPASNDFSFTTMLGNAGALGGYMPFSTHTRPGQPLYIYSVNIDGNLPYTYTQVATALLDTNGHFTLTPLSAPVPVPAAAILFGSGLVGLVGLARRSQKKQVD